MRLKNLDGDSSVETRIPRPIHFAHTTSANCRNDLVWAEPDARVQCHLKWIILLETEGPASCSGWVAPDHGKPAHVATNNYYSPDGSGRVVGNPSTTAHLAQGFGSMPMRS